MKSPVRFPCLIRRLPFAVDRAEPPRIEDRVCLSVDHLIEIFTKVAIIYRLLRMARPCYGLYHYPVEAEELLGCIARVKVIEAHRLDLRGSRVERKDQNNRGKQD